ncbi:NeuD/PglB/VioB family sugar acetyltransferase [Thiomicrorhabdus sp.]|uniref:NeuD/PglB/VioB family sugar acetyltransferase n=1 Tax=Thiomicrorhabdus sp. TaxID=2039724 RepID=UPI003567372E
MKKLLIIGAGGHGKAIAEAAQLSREYQVVGFLDDAFPELSESFSFPVLGKIENAAEFLGLVDTFFVAIGNNALREKVTGAILSFGGQLVNVIHPAAFVSPSAQMGQGIAVMAGAIIGTEALIGDGVVVNVNASVDHHCELQEFSHLGVGVSLAGGVKIGRAAWLQAACCAGYGVCVEPYHTYSPGTVLSI